MWGCRAVPLSPTAPQDLPQSSGADLASPAISTTTASQPTQSRIPLRTNTPHITPSTQKPPHGKVPFLPLPLPSSRSLSPVLGSSIAAAMGAQAERGGMGEGFFFLSLSASSSPPCRLFWQSQTPDVRSASWEVLLAPLGAEGRGKARELEPGVLSHCRTWRIPQLAAGTFPSSLLAICSKKTLSEPHHHSGYNTASSC